MLHAHVFCRMYSSSVSTDLHAEIIRASFGCGRRPRSEVVTAGGPLMIPRCNPTGHERSRAKLEVLLLRGQGLVFLMAFMGGVLLALLLLQFAGGQEGAYGVYKWYKLPLAASLLFIVVLFGISFSIRMRLPALYNVAS